jgi:transposase-like protein
VTAACRRIGEQLEINADTLRGWVKQAQIDTGKPPGTSTADAARIPATRPCGCCWDTVAWSDGGTTVNQVRLLRVLPLSAAVDGSFILC